MYLLLLLVTLVCATVTAIPPIGVIASVRGKRYEIDAETVEDLCNSVHEKCGLDVAEQSVLFRGKVLAQSDKLEDVGVAPGDTLNVVKGKRQRAARPVDDTEVTDMPEDVITANSAVASGSDVASQGFGAMGGMGGMGGMDQESLKKAIENMNPEEIQKAMKQIDQLLDNNFVDEYFQDESRLEKARMEMLNNLDQYEQMMPGFKQQTLPIVTDPVKWKKAMMEARDQINNLRAQRDLMRKKQNENGGGASDQ